MEKKPIELEEITLRTGELAELFLVGPRAIQRYVNEHSMPRMGRGRFALVSCVQWYVRHLTKRSERGEDAGIAEERRLLIRAQRQRHELELSVRRGELIDRELVAQSMNDMASIFATQLESMPARLSAELAEISEIEAIKGVLVDECRAIRTSTAGAILDSSKPTDSSVDRKTPAKAKRRPVGRRK